MIERQFIAQKIKELQIQEYIGENLKRVGHSHTKVVRTPLGEKIVIYASRPGMIIGKKGATIKKLTTVLKKKFGLENPQIETAEIENMYLDPQLVAEEIATSLEKFGSQRFKGVGHKAMENVMRAGALGVEIVISGTIPSSRAKSWRFSQGYLKKCGDTALTGVKKAQIQAMLKVATIGIKVSIMPPDFRLPDKVDLVREKPEVKEDRKQESKPEQRQEKTEEKKEEKKKRAPRKKKEESQSTEAAE